MRSNSWDRDSRTCCDTNISHPLARRIASNEIEQNSTNKGLSFFRTVALKSGAIMSGINALFIGKIPPTLCCSTSGSLDAEERSLNVPLVLNFAHHFLP